MYGILDNLDHVNLELDFDDAVFATSFYAPPPPESEIDINTYIYSKEFNCPVCRAKFTAAVVRQSRLRLTHMEELRPVYKDFEPLCYDVMMCVNCGYAAFRERFDVVSEKQQEILLEKIRLNYSNFMPATFPLEINPMQAIELYKYALLTACIKKTSMGEKAMLLIKISWLYEILGDERNVLFYTKHANEALTEAYSTERFPIFGMSEGAVSYMLASFATTLGNYQTALKFLSEIIVNKNMSTRLRDLSRDLKEKVQKLRKEAGETEENDPE
ncbi:MAG: DUF2225 domain-containing protein [Clostridiales bacterium]|jgi:uncharacterized protein (DUF2225 family)|nr:DUF2225 domain-containing protein [Clostridiales bacterium]